MQSLRSKILALAFAVIIAMGLFPPWSVTSGPGANVPGVVFSLGYHPIFLAPMMGEISVVRLFLQWIIVAIIAAAALHFSEPLERVLEGRGAGLVASWANVRARLRDRMGAWINWINGNGGRGSK